MAKKVPHLVRLAGLIHGLVFASLPYSNGSDDSGTEYPSVPL